MHMKQIALLLLLLLCSLASAQPSEGEPVVLKDYGEGQDAPADIPVAVFQDQALGGSLAMSVGNGVPTQIHPVIHVHGDMVTNTYKSDHSMHTNTNTSTVSSGIFDVWVIVPIVLAAVVLLVVAMVASAGNGSRSYLSSLVLFIGVCGLFCYEPELLSFLMAVFQLFVASNRVIQLLMILGFISVGVTVFYVLPLAMNEMFCILPSTFPFARPLVVSYGYSFAVSLVVWFCADEMSMALKELCVLSMFLVSCCILVYYLSGRFNTTACAAVICLVIMGAHWLVGVASLQNSH